MKIMKIPLLIKCNKDISNGYDSNDYTFCNSVKNASAVGRFLIKIPSLLYVPLLLLMQLLLQLQLPLLKAKIAEIKNTKVFVEGLISEKENQHK